MLFQHLKSNDTSGDWSTENGANKDSAAVSGDAVPASMAL
jgi:hypothetical protein